MQARTAGVMLALALLAFAAVPGSNAALTEEQCNTKYAGDSATNPFTNLTADQYGMMNCTFLAMVGMEATYCSGCGDYPKRLAAACTQAGANNDNCTQYHTDYCTDQYVEAILRMEPTGVCQNDCRKKLHCDKCGATDGCVWNTFGCSTKKFFEWQQQLMPEMYAPGAFYGCAWEAGKCFDFCDLTEFAGNDMNFDYSDTAKVDLLMANNISNFDFMSAKFSMTSKIGESFAKMALAEMTSEERNEECDDGDDCYVSNEVHNDASHRGDQQQSKSPVVTKVTPGGCSVNSSNMMFELLFEVPKPVQQPAPQKLDKDNFGELIQMSMINYFTSFSAGRMSERSADELQQSQQSQQSQGNRRKLLDGHDGGDHGDDGGDGEHGDDGGDGDHGDDDAGSALETFSGCFDMIKKGGECKADCKVNICADPDKVATTAAAFQGMGQCLFDEIKAKCACASTTAEQLAALGSPGEQQLPPIPMMSANFASMEASSRVKGTGSLLFFLSVIEYKASAGTFSGAASDIVQEIELDKKMEFASYPVVRRDVPSTKNAKKTGSAYYFKMRTAVTSTFELTLACAASDVAVNVTFEDRTYDIDWDNVECDIDFANFPFKNSTTSRLAVKTAVFAQSFEDDVNSEDDEGMESITVGGVKLDFAKEVYYNGSTCNNTTAGCKAPVTSSKKNIDCGSIGWYTPVYSATTQREMGFSALKCTYFSFGGVFDNQTAFSWDPKIIVDSAGQIAKSREAASTAPKVVTKPPLKAGETIAGVDKVDAAAPAAKTPVVKVKYAMPIKKFDTNTSASLKTAFAKNLDGVEAKDIKITKATFDVKSTVSFASETVESFKTKEAGFKSGLATDLSVSANQITVTYAAKTRRHLLAGVNVDYVVTGIETFETAQSMTAVAKSPSALKSVTAAVALPAVSSAGVEAQLEFEIVTADAAAASAVSTKLADTATLTKISNDVPDVTAAPKVVGQINTVAPPATPTATPTATPPPPVVMKPPPPSVVDSAAASSFNLLVAAAATVFAAAVAF